MHGTDHWQLALFTKLGQPRLQGSGHDALHDPVDAAIESGVHQILSPCFTPQAPPNGKPPFDRVLLVDLRLVWLGLTEGNQDCCGVPCRIAIPSR